MSEQNPYETLRVAENASFEEIQDAKQRLSQQYHDDVKLVQTIEAAYDAIIMERLRLRQEGKIKVPERIRFPEKEKVVSESPSLSSVSLPNPPNWLQSWLQNLIDTPSTMDIVLPGIVFLILCGVTVMMPNAEESMLSVLTSIGFVANIFFLNRKEKRFGRAVLITLVTLIFGVAIGSFTGNLLLNQGINFSLAIEQFATLVTLGLFWLTSSFLR